MKNLCFFLSIPFLTISAGEKSFKKKEDVAQYKGSDYKNVVYVERGISLERAFEIAEAHPDIDYFVYTKGDFVALELPVDFKFNSFDDPFNLIYHIDHFSDSEKPERRYFRIFRHGDAVFFNQNGMWLGSAPGLSDAYFKE